MWCSRSVGALTLDRSQFYSCAMQWGGDADQGWVTVGTKQQKKAVADAKKAQKKAEEAAEEAKAAVKLAEVKGKGKGKSNGKGKSDTKGVGKGSTGLPEGAWTCSDPACLKNLRRTAPNRGPYVNAKGAAFCENRVGPKGLFEAEKAAKNVAKKEEQAA